MEKFLNILEKADRLQKNGLSLGEKHLQIIKQRDEKGNFLGAGRRMEEWMNLMKYLEKARPALSVDT